MTPDDCLVRAEQADRAAAKATDPDAIHLFRGLSDARRETRGVIQRNPPDAAPPALTVGGLGDKGGRG